MRDQTMQLGQNTFLSRAKVLRALFFPEKSALRLIVGISVLVSVLSLAFPLAVQALVNNVAFTALAQPLVVLSALLLLVLFWSSSFQLAQMWLIERTQRRIFVRGAAGVLAKFSGHSGGGEHAGSPLLFAEISSLQKSFATLSVDGLSLILRLLTSFLVLMIYHPAFAGVSLLLLLVVLMIVLSGRDEAITLAIRKGHSKYDWIQGVQTGVLTRESEPAQGVGCDEYLEARRLYFRLLFRKTASIYAVALIVGPGIIALGGYLLLKEMITIGELVASEMIIGAIVFSLFKVPKILEKYYFFEASLDKIGSIFEDHFLIERQSRKVFRKFHLGGTGATRRIAVGLGLFASTFALALALPWTQTSQGVGRVVGYFPEDRPQTIEATISGRIKKWMVIEGQRVEKGDVLVKLEDLDPDALSRLEEQRTAIEAQLKAVLINRKVAKTNLSRQQALEKDGVVARRTIELSEMELAKITYEEGLVLAKLSEIDLKISRQRAQTVVSPVSGVVSRMFRGEGGEVVKMGEPLLVVVPLAQNNIVELWVNGIDAPLLEVGQKARVQFEGWPAFQFSGWPGLGIGTFSARVRMVDQTDDQGKFRVILEDFEGNWPKSSLLRQGTRAHGLVMLGQVTIGYELWRRINGFPMLPAPASGPAGLIYPDRALSGENDK